jgi:hypothetical protein
MTTNGERGPAAEREVVAKIRGADALRTDGIHVHTVSCGAASVYWGTTVNTDCLIAKWAGVPTEVTVDEEFDITLDPCEHPSINGTTCAACGAEVVL